jgi:hypothetical protein
VAFQFSGRCYESSGDAVTAAYSAVVPSIDSAGVLHAVEWDGTAWVLVAYDAGVVVSSSAAPALSFATCDPAAVVADASLIGWAVVAVWVGAWAVAQLRRALV